jgi:cell division protein FtsN
MSTDPHSSSNGNLPVHNDVSFETRDISIPAVSWSLFYLAVTVIVSLVICVYFFRFTTGFVAGQETPRPMVRQHMSPEEEQRMTMPEEPRLQGVPGHPSDAQQDMRDKIAGDSAENERAGWVDEKAGIAKIPVKDAMKIIAEKGLPALPPAAPEKKK